MSDITQSIEREVQPSQAPTAISSQAAGPMLRPDLDMIALLSEPSPRDVRSSEEFVLLEVPPLNGAGGLWWA